MPSGGANRLPTALKEMKGTLRPSRENHDEPRLVAKRLPGPPKALPPDEAKVWRVLKKKIDALHVASVVDDIAFGMLVDAVYLHQKTKADPNATVHEKVKVQQAASKELGRWGLNPVDRARVVALETPEEEDPLDEFDNNVVPLNH